MFEWINKKLKSTKKAKPVADKPEKKETTKKTEKELATERGEPYVGIVKLDIDPNNLHQGAFELDWNDKFVANLIRAGYQVRPDDTDTDIVDRWFQNICRHVVMETWEQEQAIAKSFNAPYVQQRDIGNGRSEIS